MTLSPAKKGLASIRKGQWVRLAAIAVCLLGSILYLTLPQILIQYQAYSNSTTADSRDYAFPLEYISGSVNCWGNGYFDYYLKSTSGAEVLVTQLAKFNGFAFALLVIGLVASGLDIWLTFTKKNEKWAKLTGLLFVICGLMSFMGPIGFMVANGFGAADTTSTADTARYWLYDSLYVHDAYGAIICGLVFIASAILFGVGTSLEGGDRNDQRNQD